jgi:hypothetical protein
LRDEAQSVSLEQSRIVTADALPQRLLDEALARVAKEPNNLIIIGNVARLRPDGKRMRRWPDSEGLELPVGKSDAALEKQESELATAVVEQLMKDAEMAPAAPSDLAAQAKPRPRKSSWRSSLSESEALPDRYPNDHRPVTPSAHCSSSRKDGWAIAFNSKSAAGAHPIAGRPRRCFKAEALRSGCRAHDGEERFEHDG